MKNYIIAGIVAVIIIVLSGFTLTYRDRARNAEVQLESYKTQSKQLEKKLEQYEGQGSALSPESVEGEQHSEEPEETEKEVSIQDYLNVLYPEFKKDNLQNNKSESFEGFVTEYKGFYAYLENGKLSIEVISSESNSEIKNITDISKKKLTIENKILNIEFAEDDNEVICAILFEDGSVGYMNLNSLLLGGSLEITRLTEPVDIVMLKRIVVEDANTTILAISKDGKFYDIIDLI